MTTVSLGFVGVGKMGQAAHLSNYMKLADCTVTAIAEPRADLANAVARRYGIEKVYSTAEQMIESEKLDGLVAIQHFDNHGQVIPGLYAAGLPILTEKPLANSSVIARRIIQALNAGTSWHMVGYHKRSDPATVGAKRIIDDFVESGELGAIRYVRVTMPTGDWANNGFLDVLGSSEPMPAASPDVNSDEDFVRFVNFYIHQVNLIRYLLGETFSVTYLSSGGVLLGGVSDSGVDVVLEMEPWSDVVGWNESALVCFEKGWVRLDLPAPLVVNLAGTVTVHRAIEGTSADTHHTYPPVHAMLAQAQRFTDAIRGIAKPPSDAHDALVDLEIADQYLTFRGAS